MCVANCRGRIVRRGERVGYEESCHCGVGRPFGGMVLVRSLQSTAVCCASAASALREASVLVFDPKWGAKIGVEKRRAGVRIAENTANTCKTGAEPEVGLRGVFGGMRRAELTF